MKKILNIKIWTLLVLVLSLSACIDDFLEQENPNAPTAESYWETVADLDNGLNAVYNSFKNIECYMLLEEHSRSDMSYPQNVRPLTKDYPEYFQTFNNSTTFVTKKWAALYNGVFRANQVIDAYEKMEADLSEQNAERALQIIAQVRALRGWFYFSLHNTYNNGSIVLHTTTPKTEADYQKSLSTSEEVIDFYRADLLYGLENLPEEPWDDTNKGRITQGACEAILGKSYLYAGDFTKAAEYFKNVFSNYTYALTEDIGSNFTTRNEFNEESILEVSYTVDYKYEYTGSEGMWNNYNMRYGVGGYGSGWPASWLNILYRNDPVDLAAPKNTVDDNGEIRYRKFSLRTSYSVALPEDNVPDIGTYYGVERTAEITTGGFGEARPLYLRKHTNWEITNESERFLTSDGTVYGRSGTNFRLIRLADVYLMYAECMIEEGDLEEALNYINKVRERSYVQLLGLSSNGEFNDSEHTYDEVAEWHTDAHKLREHLRHVERPLELSFEGNAIRVIDLRRWGVTKERFVDLAARRYNTANLEANTNGTHGKKYQCIITEYVEGCEDPDHPNYQENIKTYKSGAMNDCQEAAINYNETLHAYLPIPLTELQSNLQLSDVQSE
ncbi:RagB/SusD family nutrient uptake outer membrane protein [Saccharicrinis aurantiacus]|uniref:RagB/SusD family nutrient uptake outer membrane protein n=1 Tax=Saccharicrinis aurantiacus TaxID=1849719 RepID=UPI0008399476|nr:RagB/SusD family nutrient uptake outer membrane protein [Saccharicrinis aurantiacus]